MSHRALVIDGRAMEPGQSFTLFHSQNGADELRLYPVLSEFLQLNPDAAVTEVNDLPGTVQTALDQLLSDVKSPAAGAPRIRLDPIEENVARDELGDTIDFVQYELVVAVGETETGSPELNLYLPIFVDVGVLLLFMRFIELEAYPKAAISGGFEETRSEILDGEVDPEFVVSKAGYATLPDEPEAYELFIDTHMGVLQTLYSSAIDSKDEMVSFIVSGEYYTVARVDTAQPVPLPDPKGAGLLVDLPINDLEYPQVVSLASDWQYLGNRLRTEHGLDAAQGFLSAIDDGSIASFDTATYETALLAELRAEFGPSISELSPESFHQ
jgi:hypothetical protein